MALLEVADVVAGYGETDILHGVSIAVDEGEIVTIIGPNGCGKSTLMKAVVGLVRVKAGAVTFRGHGHLRPAAGADRANRPLLRAPVRQRLPLPEHPREPGDGRLCPQRRLPGADRGAVRAVPGLGAAAHAASGQPVGRAASDAGYCPAP